MNRFFFLSFCLLFSACALFSGKKKKSPPGAIALLRMEVQSVPVYTDTCDREIVTVGIFIRGGTQNYSRNVAGIERVALQAVAAAGTALYTPLERRQEEALRGIEVRVEQSHDFSAILFSMPRRNFTEGWNFFLNGIMNPEISEPLYQEIVQEVLRETAMGASRPAIAAALLETDSVFAGHPYGIRISGYENSLGNFRQTEALEYYRALLSKRRLLLVVQGLADTAQLRMQTEPWLSQLPEGFYAPPAAVTLPGGRKFMQPMSASLGESVLRLLFAAPAPDQEDFYSLDFCLFILRKKLELAGYPHTGSGIEICRNSHAFLTVSSESPASAARALGPLLQSFLDEGISADETDHYRYAWLREQREGREHPRQACLAAGRDFCAGLEKSYSPPPVAAGETGAARCTAAFRRWFRNPSWTLAGDTADFQFPLLNFGR